MHSGTSAEKWETFTSLSAPVLIIVCFAVTAQLLSLPNQKSLHFPNYLWSLLRFISFVSYIYEHDRSLNIQWSFFQERQSSLSLGCWGEIWQCLRGRWHSGPGHTTELAAPATMVLLCRQELSCLLRKPFAKQLKSTINVTGHRADVVEKWQMCVWLLV